MTSTSATTPSRIDIHKIKLFELKDDGVVNSFGKFRVKVEKKLQVLNLLTYITDPAPVIPPLRKAWKGKVTLPDGTKQVVSVGGNQAEVDAAKLAAEPWTQRSNETYSLIFEALPPIAVKLVQAETTAKALWDSLIQLYQNPTSYKGMDVKMWTNDMVKIYNHIVQMDSGIIIDYEFWRIINVNMPSKDTWRGFARDIR